MTNKTIKLPIRYIPRILSQKDLTKQLHMLQKSKKEYKKGQYYTRKRVKSFVSKPSSHIVKARKIYGIEKIAPTKELSKATGCSIKALRQIVKKGEGAYYSSGSRPNQTPQSWGYARLASALTSGKAASIDYDILKKGCYPNKKALQMANRSRKKYGVGHSSAKKRQIKTNI